MQDRQKSGKVAYWQTGTRVMARVNEWIVGASTIAMLAASLVLTLGVLLRYFLKVPTDWQDETAVFLIVGAIFMCGAYAQSYRRHVGIEALASILPDGCKPSAAAAGGYRFICILRILFLEVLDTFAGSHPRRSDDLFVLWPAALDSVWANGYGHDASVFASPAPDSDALRDEKGGHMSVGTIGILYGVVTLLVMFSGMPIAFSLGLVATVFMYFFMPVSALDTITQNVFEEMSSITLLSIPLFILKGVAIGKSRAGADLYSVLHAWMHKIPGGLGIANVFACGLFAAMAGSSPATCAAIGSMGVPEMRLTRLLRALRMRPHRSRRYSRYPAPAFHHDDTLRCCRRAISGSIVPCRYRSGAPAHHSVLDLCRVAVQDRVQSGPRCVPEGWPMVRVSHARII